MRLSGLYANLHCLASRIVLLPVTMHNLNIHKVFHILVKPGPAQDE